MALLGEDPALQEPSVLDQAEAAISKPKSVLDQAEGLIGLPEDKRKQQIDWILQQAATKDPVQAANVVRLANRYKLPEQFVEQNLPRLTDEEKKGNLASEDLVNSNPVLADAIAQSPNYSAAALKHLPALKQLELLYTRHHDLLPPSDAQVEQDSRKFADLRAAKDWAAGRTGPSGFASLVGDAAAAEAGLPPPGFASQKEMADDYYREELAKRKAIQGLLSKTGEMNLAESLTARFPSNTAGEVITSMMPGVRFGPSIANSIELSTAKEAKAAGTADEIQLDTIKQAEILGAIQKVRGKGYFSGLAEQFMGFPAMAGEFAVGGVIGRSGSAAMGLGKAAGFFAEPAIGAMTAGAPEAIQSFIQNKGEGDSNPEAAAKAVRDSYANYLGAQFFGPWFSKAAPETQALVRESLLKTFPIEAFKLPAMSTASELLKVIGPDAMEHLKQTEIYKALHGDSEALKSISQQSILGGVSGVGHAAIKNAGISSLEKSAQDYVDAAMERAKLLHAELSTEDPKMSQDLASKLSDAGPNKFTYLSAKVIKDHYESRGIDPTSKATELTGDPTLAATAIRSGETLMVPTAVYDHVVGSDPEAAKAFGPEIRSAPGEVNLREAQELQKAYADGIRIPPRERIIQQITDEAKGNKIDTALGVAHMEGGGDEITKDPSVLGLSGDQIAEVGSALGKARESAQNVLKDKEQIRLDRLKSGLYKSELERTQAEVTKEVDSRKEQIALARLQKHQAPDGTPLSEDVPKIKISKASLEAAGYKVSTLPRGVTGEGNFNTWGDTSTHGHTMPLEDAALNLGFASGHDLMMALAGTNRDLAIKQGTDSEMAGKFPLGLQPSEMSAEAVKALHNPESAAYQRLILKYIEANKLKQMVGVATRNLPSTAEITARARQDIASRKLGMVDPDIFLHDEQNYKRDAMAAVFAGKWEDVFDARLKALESHELYRAAMEMTGELGKTFGKFESLPDAPYLNKPGTYDFGQQIKNLLRKIGLVSVDPSDLATMKPFDAWVEEKFQAGQTRGESVRIDPKFKDEGFTTTPKDMTYGDVLSLKDTIDQITMLAKDANQVQGDARKVSIESFAKRLFDSVSSVFKELPPARVSTDDSGMSSVDKAIRWAKQMGVSLERPEFLFDRMDAGKIDGPVNEAVWHRYVEARVREAELRSKFTDALKKLEAKMPQSIAKRLDEKVTVEGMKRPVTRRELMAIVANGGNESNYSKMVRGELVRDAGKDAIGLTHETIQKAAELLTEAEKDHVQGVLDVTNMFWPEIEKLHIWATGKPPKKIEAKQMIKAMGDRAGGYYPAMYHPDYHKVGEIQIAGDIGQLIDKAWVSATTDAGYRESRIEAFAAPMDYSFGRLATHVDSMLKDIAYRPWLMDVNKLISNQEVQGTIRNYLGSEYKDFMRNWVKRAIGGDGHPSDIGNRAWDRTMGSLRHAMTVAILGLKPSVFLHHALGIGPAMAEVGPKWIMKGYGEFVSAPRDTYERMKAESPEMAHILDTMDVNVRQSLERLGEKTSTWAEFQKLSMRGIQAGNLLRIVPTYIGAKAKAMESLAKEGRTGADLEKYAILSAEKAVRRTSGSGQSGDLPAIMRSDFAKTMMMFYTPGSVLFAQMKDASQEFKRTGDFGKFMFKGIWLLPFAAAMHTIVSGRVPDEDKEETWAGHIAKDTAAYPFSALPMGSEIARGLIDAASGKPGDIQMSSPVLKALENTFRAAKKTEKWYEDEGEFEDVAREMFKTSGYFMGAPTDQLEITAGYMTDLMRHRGGSPNDMLEFFHDLLWHKPASRR